MVQWSREGGFTANPRVLYLVLSLNGDGREAIEGFRGQGQGHVGILKRFTLRPGWRLVWSVC